MLEYFRFPGRVSNARVIFFIGLGRTVTDKTFKLDIYIEPLVPLRVGTVLLDRYTIVNVVSESNDAIVYHVVTLQRCPVCSVENEGNASVCGFCEADLPIPGVLKLTERRAPDALHHFPPSSFILDGSIFTLASQASDMTSSTRALPLRLAYGRQTDPGLKRSERGEPNEDSLVAMTIDAHNDRGAALGLFLVADGVGGADAGEIASRLALQALTHEWIARIVLPEWNGNGPGDQELRAEILAGLAETNTLLQKYQSEHNLQFGTTLTAAIVLNDRAYVVNLGDSRTYLFRRGTLTPITRDHSYVAMLIANGLLAPEEAYTHPQRNLILRSLGDVTCDPDIFPEESGALALEAGDQLLLCSDGLWEMVRDADIQHVLENAIDPQTACAALVNLANSAGGADNISVILVRCDTASQ